MDAGNVTTGEDQAAFPFIAEADAADRSARQEFSAALTAYFERAKGRFKDSPASPFATMSPDALRAFAFLREGVMIEKEVRLGAGGHPLVVARADLLHADLRRRMAADVAASAPPAQWTDPFQTSATAEDRKIPPQSNASAFSTAPSAAPAGVFRPVPPPALVAAAPRALLFSAALADYLALREGAGVDRGTISTARMRAEVFIAVMGDKPIDAYLPYDLQKFVNEAQHLPLAYGKEMPESSTVRAIGPKAAIEINKKDNCWERLTRKTLEDGYLPAIKAVINYTIRIHPMPHPFGNMRLIWPKTLRPSATREALDAERLNDVFRYGVASGFLDDALLPALAQTTSRRLGLLAYMRGSDFETKHGVSIGRVDGVAFDSQKGKWYRTPYKTTESLSFFVLHKLWDECGFIDWARAQGDAFIFRQLHACADPSDAASKRCGRLLQKAGAIGCNIEVPHALRHGAKDAMVDAAIDGETRRKQMGQSTRVDVHDDYGSNRTLTREECQKLAKLPLMKEVDWSVFKGLDFEAMASKIRKGGRPKKDSAA